MIKNCFVDLFLSSEAEENMSMIQVRKLLFDGIIFQVWNYSFSVLRIWCWRILHSWRRDRFYYNHYMHLPRWISKTWISMEFWISKGEILYRIIWYCDIITVTQPNDDWLAYLLMVGQLWTLKFEACQVIQLVMELYWVGTFNCLGWKQLQLHQFTVQQLISNQTEQSGGKTSQHSLHMFH